MVAIKIVFTVLGLYVVCSRTAPNYPTLISKLLTQPEVKDVKIPVRRQANDGVSPQNYYDVRSSRIPHRETISRILRGMLLKEQLRIKNINDKRSSQIVAPRANSEDTSAVQVSPNVHSDYLHIENYVPTFITIPRDSRLCDPQSYANLNCQILHKTQSNIPFTNSINCPQYAPSHNNAGDHSDIISEAPNVKPFNPPSAQYLLSNTNEEFASLHTSDDHLSDTELSDVLQSKISNIPLIESEHSAIPKLPSLPSTYIHPEFHETSYDIVKDAINADLHDSDYHKFAEFTSYPQLSITANDEIITPGIETNLPLNPPCPFESTVYLPIPEPDAYFPLNLSNTETVNHDEIVSLQDSLGPSNTITIPEKTQPTFENQPIIVIPEAPILMPLSPPNISNSYSPENTTADAFIQAIYSDNLEISHSETTPDRGDIIESINTSGIQTNVAMEPASPIEPTVLIPEPPIYFPLKPSNANTAGQSEAGEIGTLLDIYESSNAITIPENTPSSLDSLPNIIIPEAPELMPLNPPNITLGSYLENISAHEVTQSVYSDYSDQSYPEITTEPEEIIESTYVDISPAPALMPLNPPNITLTLTDILYSNENCTSNLVGTEILNVGSIVQNSKPNNEHTIDHAHSITLEDSPNLLISHFINTQNDMALVTSELPLSSPNCENSSLQNQPIEIADAPELTPLNKPHFSIISSDNNLYNEDNTDEVIYYDNQKESLSVDSVKIPEAPLLMPLNPPFTSPPLNSIVTSNHSFVNAVIQEENGFNTNEVLNLSSKPQTSTLESDMTKDEVFIISEVPTTNPPTVPPNPIPEGSELNPESTPLNILLTMNQQITLPQILHNSHVLVVSNNHNEIRGQKQHSISSSPEYSSSVHEDSDPLSIVQDSNIVVSSSPFNVEKTNEIVSQLDSTIQKLKIHNTEKQMQRNFRDLPPCESEKPIDGVVINVFEPKKCKEGVKEWMTNSSSKQSISKRSRKRKVVVRNPKSKQTNISRNKY